MDGGTGPVTLPVFDTWTFTTGLASTFEEVVGLLGPVDPAIGLDLGYPPGGRNRFGFGRSVARRISRRGRLCRRLDRPRRRAVGARRAAGRVPRVGDPLLEAGSARVVLGTTDDEPVVTPPLYGAYAARDHTIPDVGWRRFVNLTLRHRMAAGLGARIVRRHQERYMAEAWAQAGEVREAQRALNASRLQAEIGRTLTRRARRLDDGLHVAVLRAQYTTVRDQSNVAARGTLEWSAIPNGLFDAVMTRTLRPGSTAGRAAQRRVQRGHGDDTRPTPDTTTARLQRRLGDPDARGAYPFRVRRRPAGAVMLSHRNVDPDDVLAGAVDPWTGSAASRFDDEHPDVTNLTAVARKRSKHDPTDGLDASARRRRGSGACAATSRPADSPTTRSRPGSQSVPGSTSRSCGRSSRSRPNC